MDLKPLKRSSLGGTESTEYRTRSVTPDAVLKQPAQACHLHLVKRRRKGSAVSGQTHPTSLVLIEVS